MTPGESLIARSDRREMAREWRVIRERRCCPACKICSSTWEKRKGVLLPVLNELLVRLDALKLQTLEFHWAESEANTGARITPSYYAEVTVRASILLDSWRAQPHVTWTQVTKDRGIIGTRTNPLRPRFAKEQITK